MQFMAVRELRGNSAQAWEKLQKERELVITSNGKPIAIMTAVSEENLEESLKLLRRLQAVMAVEAMQQESTEKGLDKLPLAEINKEILAVRKKRAK
jgi:antitoxin (DNA-binding transcriptional repressor) of toxin-antitoxin stability system